MSDFGASTLSSPLLPSTPRSNSKNFHHFHGVDAFASNHSTTPAGAPPSSARSFTPTGAPPSSIFGSSQLGSVKPLFKSNAYNPQETDRSVNAPPPARPSPRFDFSNGHNLITKNKFALPSSSPLSRSLDEREQRDDEPGMKSYAEMETHADLSDIGDTMNGSVPLPLVDSFWSTRPAKRMEENPLRLSALSGSPRGVKRSRADAMVSKALQRSAKKSPKPKVDLGIALIAKIMTDQLGVAPLEESDDFILGTEDLINRLVMASTQSVDIQEAHAATIARISDRLCGLWTSCRKKDLVSMPWKNDMTLGLGPNDDAPRAHNAVFLSTLLLSIQHPAAAKGKQALASSHFNRSLTSLRESDALSIPSNPTAYPKILLDWLQNNHNPYAGILPEVKNHSPSPSAHPRFWDMIFTLAIRGRFVDLVRMLETGDFEHAVTAREDGYESGYKNAQLDKIQTVVRAAIDLLNACPALTDDDLNVTGNAWVLFRRHVERAMRDLAETAEGSDKDSALDIQAFEATGFGLSTMSNDLSKSSRRAESRVPWSVYQNLKTVYGILLGGTTEILSLSGDWVEATIALTAWWNGEDDEEIAVSNLAMTRRSLRQTRSKGPRLVDEDPKYAYLTRLSASFDRVVSGPDEECFQPDTSKPLEVALCAIFERNTRDTIALLRCFSLPIADAVTELALGGGWLESPQEDAILQGFDQDDMDIMGLEKSKQPSVTRTTVMEEYAEALFDKKELYTQQGRIIEGWELAIAVLARLSPTDDEESKSKIYNMLDRLPLKSDKQIDKVLEVCRYHGMAKQGNEIVMRYADGLLEDSSKYGTALIYYARIHSMQKVKDLLDLLISYSLVRSAAFPPAAELDHNLHALVFAPKAALERLALLDHEAAKMLHMYMAGYATLRQFYNIRDSADGLKGGETLSRNPSAEKREALTALLAVIDSAAEDIYGGLHDKSRGSVVQVDGLLALCGEATVFVNQSPPLLTLPQSISLLRAIENLSTTTQRIYVQCEEFLRSTLAAYHGDVSNLSEPRKLLKQMSSSVGSFSLVGSSVLESQTRGSNDAMDIDIGDSDPSQALTRTEKDNGSGDGIQRGWDWRANVQRGAKGEDVIRLLRLGLAEEIAGLWIRE